MLVLLHGPPAPSQEGKTLSKFTEGNYCARVGLGLAEDNVNYFRDSTHTQTYFCSSWLLLK